MIIPISLEEQLNYKDIYISNDLSSPNSPEFSQEFSTQTTLSPFIYSQSQGNKEWENLSYPQVESDTKIQRILQVKTVSVRRKEISFFTTCSLDDKKYEDKNAKKKEKIESLEARIFQWLDDNKVFQVEVDKMDQYFSEAKKRVSIKHKRSLQLSDHSLKICTSNLKRKSETNNKTSENCDINMNNIIIGCGQKEIKQEITLLNKEESQSQKLQIQRESAFCCSINLEDCRKGSVEEQEDSNSNSSSLTSSLSLCGSSLLQRRKQARNSKELKTLKI